MLNTSSGKSSATEGRVEAELHCSTLQLQLALDSLLQRKPNRRKSNR
jgi:hypothetical protein